MPLAAVGWPLSPLLVESLVVVVVAVVLVESQSRAAIAVALVSMLLVAVGGAMRVLHPSPATNWLSHVGSIVGLSTVTWVILRAVFAAGPITVHRIQGAVVVYLNVAIIFTSAYRLMVESIPTAFHGLPPELANVQGASPKLVALLVYYSFTTLTSTGYGDIVPVHPFARSVSNLEAVLGQLYPATMLARVVTLELEFRRQRRRGGEEHD
ncbi:MAG: two pore domain potassium channel family protein [Proteobacteria bacterium]|nr:two pore domain potassium channel family protein [Pseudomonadota bacterium]